MENNKIIFINQKISGQKPDIPKLLYKYRPFDGYTFDMLDNAYLYLCPAKDLDDPSECTVSFYMQDYFDFESNRLNFRCVELILDLIRPYTSKGNFNKAIKQVNKAVMPDGYLERDSILLFFSEIEKHTNHKDYLTVMNFNKNINEHLNDSILCDNIKQLIEIAIKAKELIGICSLSVLDNDAEMWENYTDGSAGYCVEFDMTGYEHSEAVFPVIYDDERANNIAMTIMADFIAQAIYGISSGQLSVDRSNYIRMFLTKASKWDYQHEWRILGDANERIAAPAIKAIYLGKNVSEKNKQAMQQYCEKYKIPCIQR